MVTGPTIKILTLILVAWLSVNLSNGKRACRIVNVVDGIGYEKEVLNDKLIRPYMLTIDYSTNTLFYSHKVDSLSIGSRYVDLKTKDSGEIGGVKGGFAHAVDSKNHDVYIGGQDGVYKFDYATKTGTKVSAEDINIWDMFFKDKLYFTKYQTGKKTLYTFENGQANIVESLKEIDIALVAVDKNDYIFISNETGLYRYNKDFEEGKYYGDFAINSLTSDVNGDIYFSTPSSINKVESDSVTKLFDFKKSVVYGLAIEADGTIIYSDETKVYILKRTQTKCNENKD